MQLWLSLLYLLLSFSRAHPPLLLRCSSDNQSLVFEADLMGLVRINRSGTITTYLEPAVRQELMKTNSKLLQQMGPYKTVILNIASDLGVGVLTITGRRVENMSFPLEFQFIASPTSIVTDGINSRGVMTGSMIGYFTDSNNSKKRELKCMYERS